MDLDSLPTQTSSSPSVSLARFCLVSPDVKYISATPGSAVKDICGVAGRAGEGGNGRSGARGVNGIGGACRGLVGRGRSGGGVVAGIGEDGEGRGTEREREAEMAEA
ncbi:merozoite surface antigen 2, allelic form 3-like [Prunus dulcis]|uniref:merozoite surface antigen 2, allelic form 3-like n=1 Tax=Prunus dulcis TaxID=3755 RepID=UPI0014821037|nr:merozoite surface antigen 2, allelic form 3-like [Prunus dulcis]